LKLQFDANQDYQLDAIASIVDLFKGQPGRGEGVATFGRDALTSLQLTEVGVADRCVLSSEQWLDNLQAVQQREGAFRLSTSCFNQWQPQAFESGEVLADQIQLFMNTGELDTEPAAIANELTLKASYPLTTRVDPVELCDSVIYLVDGGALAQLLEPFETDMIGLLIEREPKRVIALDREFTGSDQVKTNLALQCRDSQIVSDSY